MSYILTFLWRWTKTIWEGDSPGTTILLTSTISSIVPAWPLKTLSMWLLLPTLSSFQHPVVLPTWDSFHLCASFKEGACWKWRPCPQLEPTIHTHKGKSFLSLKMRAQFFWIIHLWITHLLASMYLHPFTRSFPKCFGKPSYSHIKRWKSESESCSVVSDSLWPHGLSMEFSRPEYSSGLSLFQGIYFPTQGSNPGLPHCRRILYQLSQKGSPGTLEWVAYPFSKGFSWPRNRTRVSHIVGRFFTKWAIREAQKMKRWNQFFRVGPYLSSWLRPGKSLLLFLLYSTDFYQFQSGTNVMNIGDLVIGFTGSLNSLAIYAHFDLGAYIYSYGKSL